VIQAHGERLKHRGYKMLEGYDRLRRVKEAHRPPEVADRAIENLEPLVTRFTSLRTVAVAPTPKVIKSVCIMHGSEPPTYAGAQALI